LIYLLILTDILTDIIIIDIFILTDIIIGDAAEVDLIEHHRITHALRVDCVHFHLVGGTSVDPKQSKYRRAPRGGDVIFGHEAGVLKELHLETLGEAAIETLEAFDLQTAVCVVCDGAVHQRERTA
jgi:hypothetical protein